jgi:hypothetical protein
MIPDMKSAVALDLAQDAVRGSGKVMRRLEDVWNVLWYGYREDEEITVPHIEGSVHLH